jgi:translation initiation factor 2 beta subunit (eIF-2beta)/eIF-5
LGEQITQPLNQKNYHLLQTLKQTIMETFNKYELIKDLTNQLKTEIKKFNVNNTLKIYEFIEEYIENQCEEYLDCFNICKELNAIDFRAYDSECNTIKQLAYACLYEFVLVELDYNELEELINKALKS